MAVVLDRCPSGGITLISRYGSLPEELQARIRRYDPRTDLGALIKAALAYLPPKYAKELLDAVQRTVVLQSELVVRIFRADPITGRPWPKRLVGEGLQPIPIETLVRWGHRDRAFLERLIEDHGVVSRKVITNAGIDYLVDALQNVTEPENINFHALGTGVTAEAATQTALVTELTTQYNPDNTRATGTRSEVAGTPTKYRTTGTNTLDAAATVEEHGVMTQAATGGGTLWDRSLTGTQTLAANDSLQSQYDLTANAGG